jgi:hypothetical protein
MTAGFSSLANPAVHRSTRWVLAAAVAMPFSWSAALATASGPSMEIDWRTSALDLDLRGMNGERYDFRCPPRVGSVGRVVGSGPYTDISSICGASAQAGVIDPGSGGPVTIEVAPGADDYTGAIRNGIRSESLHAHWSGSFIVLPAAKRRGEP